MASVPKEFVNKMELLKGLTANKDYTRFHFRFKIDGSEYYKTFDYTKQISWTPAVRKKNIVKEATKYKDDKAIEMLQPFNPATKVDFIAKEYFEKKCTDTAWTKARIRLYELYIKPFIGTKKISSIKEHSVDTIRANMEKTNYHQYQKGGCSIRSIEKVLFQTLKPILVYAKNNGAIDNIPPITIPNRPKKSQRKKKVTDASNKLLSLHNAIHTRYAKDPFYRALFLLAFNGRRWNEIKTLEWKSIDLNKNKYTVEAEHNKIGEAQDYFLSDEIKIALEEMNTNKEGLVFISPVTGKALDTPRRQLAKIKEDTGIEELTMHYFRHILVTALGEIGVAQTIMSASLGHTRADTVDEVYRSINHLQSSHDATIQLEYITGGGK